MQATLWAANADEIDGLIIWLDNHPEEADELSRDALARWLVELLRNAEVPILRRCSRRGGRCA